ncbi:MAG: DUF885 domain-containing protein [Proteobacteria bacterium]|nr:DUF885 domain-containing protein [Pseudomonadota bacterium]
MKKLFAYAALAVFLAGGVFVSKLIWFKPFQIDHFFDRVFLLQAFNKPEMLTQIHMLEQYGISFHQSKLDDESQKAGERQREFLRDSIAILNSYQRENLSYDQALSFDIYHWYLTHSLKTADQWRYHNYPVNQLFGVQNNFPSFMESSHPVTKESEARDYIARLSKLGLKFEQLMEGLKIRESKSIIPPSFVIDKVLEEMQAFVASKPEDNILYKALANKMLKSGKFSELDQAHWLDQAKTQLVQNVYPAYQSYIDYFTRLRTLSTNDAGVWKFPDGDLYYAHALESQTSLKIEPEALHQLGLNEVARIQAEMLAILADQGYDSKKPVGTLMAELSEEPRFLYPDTEQGRQEILLDYQTIINEVSAGLDAYFSLRPKAPVKVERIPVFKEKTAPGAYYNGPALDGSRPGVFYANLYDIKATEKFGMRTLAYHEAVPGHHFQISIAQETKGLPLFRRMAPFTAFIEGWALYAERVAWEAGFQKNPFDNLGRLQAELFRSVRLVVDTGIHAKRWSREQAIDYMLSNTGMAKSDVVAEIERYIVMPGQACAYKVGMLKFQELRTKAEHALGQDFDIKAFHAIVLKNGPMPLTILERVVDDWIAHQLIERSKNKV